jgi:energy-coupling factor transporter transmembrane protein EcfT
MILDQTIRALFLLGETARELLEALSLRSFGGKNFVPTTWILGALFLRTTELSRQTGEALIARGYSGVWPVRPRRIEAADFLYLSLALAVWAASALIP